MTAQEYYEKADSLYEKKQYEESLEYIKKALELEPKNPEFLVLNYNVFLKTNELDQAIEGYLKIIKIDPEHAGAYNNLGLAYKNGNQIDQAIRAFLKAIEIDSEYASAYNNLGLAYAGNDQLEEAITAHQKAIEINPESVRAYNNLGLAYAGNDQLEEAITAYQKAIEINPELADVYNNLGLVYRTKGKLEEAITVYQKAIKINPELADVCNNLGLVYKTKGKLEEAITVYQKAIKINPKLNIAFYNLGTAYYKKGQLEEAITAYQKAIKINPKLANAFHGLGRVFYKKNQLNKAEVAYQKAIEINSEFAEAYNCLGLVYFDKGQLEKAITAYQKAIEFNPKFTEAYNNLGLVYYDKGQIEEAISAFKKIIEINPKSAHAYNSLGIIHYNAIESFEGAREQLAQRYFFKALLLQTRPMFLGNYLKLWHEYPKHFFFLQDLFPQLLSLDFKNRELSIQEEVADKCKHINLSLLYYESLEVQLEINNLEWLQFTALINYFMGHPLKAFHIFRDKILPKAPTNLQAHYYLIQSCYDFLENEKPYFKSALDIAEKIKQRSNSEQLESAIQNEAEILQRYYAALLFKDNNDIGSALKCITPIWNKTDYLPLLYLYHGLLFIVEEKKQESRFSFLSRKRTNLKILAKSPFPQIGRRILELETSSDREKYFAYGFPLHPIDPDREKWWEPFYHYAHYNEIAPYISLWKLQAEHHFNKRKLGIVAGDSLKEFWDSFTIEGVDITIMQEQIQKYSHQKIGQLFLEKAKEHLQGIAFNIDTEPIHLKESIEFVLYESGKTNEYSKRAYEELKEMPGKTENALVYRIASKIEANELGSDLATYYYLNSYFFLSNHLTEKEYIMLNMYATYVHAYLRKEMSKILQGGLKDQFKEMLGIVLGVTMKTVANPVLSLTLGALKPLAKGSMGELFIRMIKDIKYTTMMRYAVPTYARPPYEKQIAAPSFKEAFLEFVGKEKERLGHSFENVYPMYGFEEWIES